jgi:hypothetical protein
MGHLLLPSAKSADQGDQRQQRPDRDGSRRARGKRRLKRARQVGGGPRHGPPLLGWQENEDVLSQARGGRGNEGEAAADERVGRVDDRDAIRRPIYR